MKKTLLLAAFGLSLPAVASAQLLFEESFPYPDSTVISGTGGWVTHSGTTGQIKANDDLNLTFASTPAYPSNTGSGIRLFSSRGEDINHVFTQQVEGTDTTSVYLSAVVVPNAVPNSPVGSYFIHLANTALTGTSYVARVFMAAGTTPGTVRFGITKSGNTPVFAPTEYPLGSKVLLVARYDIVPGATNDTARLYIFEEGESIATEPVVADAVAGDITGADALNVGTVAIRQGTTSAPGGNAGSQTVDGVRVATAWTSAPLPVELSAFTGAADGTTARLAWTTASETNNVGFGIEQLQGASWTERGFVAGHGTTTERNTYAFDVANLTAGRHTFRLRQIDTDGTVNYSPLVSVEIGVASGLTLTALGTRALRVQSETDATVAVYDLLGRQVMTQRVEPGTSEMRFDGLSAGVYVVRATAGAAATTLSVVVR